MTTPNGPLLSVILVTPDRYATIRRTVRALRLQTARDRLELVIVAPRAEALQVDWSELGEFFGVRLVEVGWVPSAAAAKAAGAQASSAPLVAFGEDHSYPEPGWAEGLIRAHRGPWAAVGAVIVNANPGSVLSWANLLPDFGPWLAPTDGGEVDRLPWHHTSYKREILLDYGTRLWGMLEVEALLHRDLRERGHRLYLEPSAMVRHVNISRMSSTLQEQFHSGRQFGAARARDEHWSIFRRLLYVGGVALIPPLRLRRLLSRIPPTGPGRWLLPVLTFTVCLHTLGEAVGYLFGAGTSPGIKGALEFHRERHVGARDRADGVVG